VLILEQSTVNIARDIGRHDGVDRPSRRVVPEDHGNTVPAANLAARGSEKRRHYFHTFFAAKPRAAFFRY
jgi:hypothetical protein